jgi:two-component system CheB/CheR fusion protein
MGEAVLVLDQTGQVVLVSSIFNRMFPVTGINFAPEDDEGRPLPASAHPQERAARGESFQMEFMLSDPEGNRRWFEARGQRVNPGSTDGDSVIVIRDVTDRGLLQLQDEFMAVASHELRTPLTALQGYLEMMMRRADSSLSPEQVQTYAANALGQTRRLGALVSDLTDASRLRTGKLSLSSEPVDLVLLVRRVIDLTKHAMNGRAIHADIPSDAITVMGDPGRLEQVVLNLLTNAQTHAPNASTIDISVKRADGQGEVTVHDNGPGVPEEHRASIFKRFYQVARDDHYHDGGLGLGLYIVRAIVTEHGGSVDFNSEVGSGTTFIVRLPLTNAEVQGADQDSRTLRQP